MEINKFEFCKYEKKKQNDILANDFSEVCDPKRGGGGSKNI